MFLAEAYDESVVQPEPRPKRATPRNQIRTAAAWAAVDRSAAAIVHGGRAGSSSEGRIAKKHAAPSAEDDHDVMGSFYLSLPRLFRHGWQPCGAMSRGIL